MSHVSDVFLDASQIPVLLASPESQVAGGEASELQRFFHGLQEAPERAGEPQSLAQRCHGVSTVLQRGLGSGAGVTRYQGRIQRLRAHAATWPGRKGSVEAVGRG